MFPRLQNRNMFYRRSVFEECGGFDESLPYLEDTDLGYRS
jgi:GT2 family glycosyltransferase